MVAEGRRRGAAATVVAIDHVSASWLGGIYRWLTSGPPVPGSRGGGVDGDSRDGGPLRIAHYAIARKLGAGGMGVVYQAYDERLARTVAVKMMLGLAHDETARQRFWREARAAASVNHPNVCQIYEVGEEGGHLFIAMELLEGQSLEAYLTRGPLSVDEAMPIAAEMLAALGAIHARGIVHRDLKPSNVYLTRHGVKLLDFGLARPEVGQTLDPAVGLTHNGVVLGTPRYMAPEQVKGEPVDARSDLFAMGAILFEMLAGRPAFNGRSVLEILNATLTEQPPALGGSPAVAAVDRVIRRALAKSPAGRPISAEAMAEQLDAVRGIDGREARGMAQALTRVVVLPFRVLRPDPETDFLAFSLPDAITTSLAGMGSLIVRSSATAARFAGEAPDIKALAVEADVDRVVMGTLLRVATSCARRRSWSKCQAGRCSPRTRCSLRSAICFGCRTTSPGRSSTDSRCRWPGGIRRRRMRRATRAPTSSISGPTGWPAPTRRSRTRARCTSRASSSTRTLLRRGRILAAAIA